MRLSQIANDVIYYLEVEPEYVEPTDGKGKTDAVSFVMAQENENGHEIDSVVSVSDEVARQFADFILKTCDEIEGKVREEEMNYSHIEDNLQLLIDHYRINSGSEPTEQTKKLIADVLNLTYVDGYKRAVKMGDDTNV